MDCQCPRVLGEGEAPAEEAHETVVESLAPGMLGGHEVVEGQVYLASGDGSAVHFGVEHGVVEQGREEHVRRGGSPRDAVPSVAGTDGELPALRLHIRGRVIDAAGCPMAEVRGFSAAFPTDGVFGDVEGLAFVKGFFIPGGHGRRRGGGYGAGFQAGGRTGNCQQDVNMM